MRNKGIYILRWVIISIALIVGISPFVWIVLTSFKSVGEVLLSYPPTIFPKDFTFNAYIRIFEKVKFARFILNSFTVTIPTTIIGIFISSLAAYSFARLKFPLKNFLFYSVLVAMMFPGTPILIPLFRVMKNLNLNDSLYGLIILYLSKIIPLSTWMLYGYIKTIPREIEESAIIDGCTRIRIYAGIVLPLIKPGIGGVTVFIFLVSWNDFIYALVMLNSESKFTISLGLVRFITDYATFFDQLSAGSIIVIIPVIFMYVLFGHYLIKGLSAGAVKG